MEGRQFQIEGLLLPQADVDGYKTLLAKLLSDNFVRISSYDAGPDLAVARYGFEMEASQKEQTRRAAKKTSLPRPALLRISRVVEQYRQADSAVT
jgi:hypothetical protein